MSQLKIEINNGKTAFRPGEDISGIAVWQLDREPEAVEIRIFWYTLGKGTQDVAIVETVRFDNPGLQAGHPFTIQAPNGPYSFSGTLISLVWALELVVLPSKDTDRANVTISSTGSEIALTSTV
jgi:hypothetical protein